MHCSSCDCPDCRLQTSKIKLVATGTLWKAHISPQNVSAAVYSREIRRNPDAVVFAYIATAELQSLQGFSPPKCCGWRIYRRRMSEWRIYPRPPECGGRRIYRRKMSEPRPISRSTRRQGKTDTAQIICSGRLDQDMRWLGCRAREHDHELVDGNRSKGRALSEVGLGLGTRTGRNRSRFRWARQSEDSCCFHVVSHQYIISLLDPPSFPQL